MLVISNVMLWLMFIMSRVCMSKFCRVQGLSCLVFVYLGLIVSSVCLSRVGYGTQNRFKSILVLILYIYDVMKWIFYIDIYIKLYHTYVLKKMQKIQYQNITLKGAPKKPQKTIKRLKRKQHYKYEKNQHTYNRELEQNKRAHI